MQPTDWAQESYNRKGKGKGDDPRDMMAHVVIEYHVPPSKVSCPPFDRGGVVYQWREEQVQQTRWTNSDNADDCAVFVPFRP